MSNEKKASGGREMRKTASKPTASIEVLEPKEVKQYNPLKNRKVLVKPIKRNDAWLPPSHEANFLYKDAYFEIAAPVDSITGNIVQPLDQKELEFFENIELSHIHGLNYRKGDLSANKDEKNVWWTHEGEFYLRLKNEVKVLDLSNSKQYILYKMLLANKELIAPDGEAGTPGKLGHKATFKFKIEEEGFEENKTASAAEKRKLAYKLFGKIEDNREEMITVLSLAYPGKAFKYESTLNSLISGIDELISENTSKFIAIVEDENFKMKAFIHTAVKLGFIVKETNKFYTVGGDFFLGRNISEASEYLSDTENQGVYIEIKDKIKALD